MSRTSQDKTAKPDAVELNDAALVGVAGGGEVQYYSFDKIALSQPRSAPGDVSIKGTLTLIAD